jgi:hypothetical protein
VTRGMFILSLSALVHAGRNARIAPMTIVTAVEMAILDTPGAENDRRGAAAVMCFPLAAASACAAVGPGERLTAAFACGSGSVKRRFDLGGGEFVDKRHFFFLTSYCSTQTFNLLPIDNTRNCKVLLTDDEYIIGGGRHSR